MAASSSAAALPPASAPVSAYIELVDAIVAAMAQYSRETCESAGRTARGLISACTFEDVVRLQTDFAKRSFAGFLARSTKLSELGCSLLGLSVGAGAAQAKV